MALANKWQDHHNVTVGNFNPTHHPLEREYFDSPIKVPKKGYSHARVDRKVPFQVYMQLTPIRTEKHTKKLVECFKRMEAADRDKTRPKLRFDMPLGTDHHGTVMSNCLSN